MNFLSGLAYDDGCDYMYRINDDTTLVNAENLKLMYMGDNNLVNPYTKVNKWTSIYIKALKSFRPPNVGVVGPRVIGAHENHHILSHDFVSRKHFAIFGFHYPPIFTDWYLDNWISRVYGEKNTLKLKTVIVQHSGNIESRYKVSILKRKAGVLLDREVTKGRKQILAYLKATEKNLKVSMSLQKERGGPRSLSLA